MTNLESLRNRLSELRRRRQLVRWGNAYAALAVAVLWTLAAAFAVDWLFEMTRPQRLLTLAVCAAAVAWAVRRFTLPWLGIQESEIDVALQVERAHKIDSDLVAALQFESAEAPRWGSVQLERAVIDYVADTGNTLNVFEGFSMKNLVHRTQILAATLALLALGISLSPAYARAFVNRFFLGSAHYPTRTNINRILVNGTQVDRLIGNYIVVRSPYGQPVCFEVHVSGEKPAEGKVSLRAAGNGMRSAIPLNRKTDEPQDAVVYEGRVNELLDTVDYELTIGDAWTDPARVVVIALPVVDVKLTVTPPDYVVASGTAKAVELGSRQISVIEGSRVALDLVCPNKKLTSAGLTIEGTRYSLQPAPSSAAGSHWAFNDDAAPFAQVAKPIQYEIQVADEDGLSLPQPIRGTILIKPDQRPQIIAAAVTRFVLPTARPPIHYRALDDYGIARLLVHTEILRADGSISTPERIRLELVHAKVLRADGSRTPEPIRALRLDAPAQPVLTKHLPLRDDYALDLGPLNLVKGDRVKVALEAVDYRGALPGQSTLSEPFMLQVTDEVGIIEDITKPDEQSANQLEAIIKQQLGIGGSK